MGTINIKPERKQVKMEGKVVFRNLYRGDELEKFNPEVLGLGNIGQKSRRIDVIAAIFDLEGFTDFCSQVDAHLSMPRFLQEFLDWLFESLAYEFVEKKFSEGTLLYTDLPFFAKFTGDGVLFLWDTENMNMRRVCNVAVLAENICGKYSRDFVPKAKKYLSLVPKGLRCGVACGMVCSVGNGEDYVGSCINIASRLQKLSNLRFCFSQRGIDLEKGMIEKTARSYIVKRVSIRGIGRDERVLIDKSDFEKLSKKDKAVFKKV